jgi:hypothetical protein
LEAINSFSGKYKQGLDCACLPSLNNRSTSVIAKAYQFDKILNLHSAKASMSFT